MSLLDVSKSEIDQFLSKYQRTMANPEFYFSVDNNQDKVEDFTEDKLKVLVVFLSNGKNRAVSNTFNALNCLAHENLGDKVFVDCCYYPEEEDKEKFLSNGIPYVFGCATHLPIKSFDLVLVACCVMPEVLNLPHVLKHCGIGLTVEERAKQDVPMLVFGGAAANEAAIVLGPITRDGQAIGKSLVDMATYGYGEKVVPQLTEAFYNLKIQGANLHDKGSVKESLISNNILHDNIFYPERYGWVYDEDRFTIKEIKKLDDRLPDRVVYNRIKDASFKGFPLKVFPLTGESADGHDIMISSGCSGQSSTCSFCHPSGSLITTARGLVKIEEVVEGDSVVTGSGKINTVLKVHAMGTKDLVRITLKNGYSLMATPCHRVAVYNGNGEVKWVDVKDITCDDNLIVYRNTGVPGNTDRYPEFVGRMVADGTWNSKFSLFCNTSECDYISEMLSDLSIGFTIYEKERNTFEFSLRKSHKVGFPEYLAEGKSIPKEVFAYNNNQILLFMKGLFGGDGTISKNGDISVSSKSKSLLEDVQILLLQIGVLSSISMMQVNWKEDKSLGRAAGIQILYRLFIKDRTSYDKVRGVLFDDGHQGYSNLVVPSSYEERQLFIKENSSFSYIKDRSLTHNIIKKSKIEGEFYDLVREDKVVVLPVVLTEEVGAKECYDLTVENEHNFIVNGILSHNCMEGTVSGVYRERELEDIVKDMKYVIKTAASNTISFYSYNLNYYKHFMDLLAEAADNFKGLTLLNERLDIVANAPEQLALAKRLGLKRFSGAIEGMGNRVRNQIFNKNLPRETLMQAVRVVYGLKLMHMKCGMITYGGETEADIDDFISEIDEMLSIRAEMGANTSLQFNVTPLVLYSQIALRYMPRRTAEMSFNRERNMQKLIQACQERSIRIKFNGRGCGTWLEQLILDFGPAGTDWMVSAALDNNLYYARNFGDKDKEASVKALTERGYEPLFFIKERPMDWIFPNDHIIYADKKLIELWKQRHQAKNFDTPLCLNTLAQRSPKCHNCGMCEGADILKMLKRDLTDKNTLDQVIDKLSENRHVDTLRVVAKMKPGWELVNREVLSHFISAQFMRLDDSLVDAFYGCGKNSTSWTSSNGQKGWFGGLFAFDMQLKSRVSESKFKALIDEVNKHLYSCQVVNVFGDTKSLPVKRESDIAYLGQTTAWSLSQIKDKLSNFDWGIKVAVKSMGGQLDFEVKHMPELKDKLLLVQKGRAVLIYSSLPSSISPYLVMSSILGKGYEKMLEDFKFNILDQGIEVDAVCTCGRHLTYSIMTGENKSRCQICEGKRLLAMMLQ